MMELAKERPTSKVKRETVSTPAIARQKPISSSEIQKLVKRVESLEVVGDDVVEVACEVIASSEGTSTKLDENETLKENEPAEKEEKEVERKGEENELKAASSSTSHAMAKSQSKQEANSKPGRVETEEIKSQLYPEINRLRLQELEAEAKSVEQRRTLIRAKESAPPMALALEPLTEMQLRSFYYNAELERVDDFEDEFLRATLRPTPGDVFFALLQSYLDSCRRVEQLLLDAKDLNQRWDSARRNVWLMENVVQKQQGLCGEGRSAFGAYTVQRAKFQEKCVDELKNLARKRRNLRLVQLAFASHKARTAELECKHYVCVALQNFRALTGIDSVSPCLVRFDEPSGQISAAKTRLRNCMSVLFYFLRQPALESTFNASCRNWLNDLSGTLLRYSFVDDHLFLLSHVLRCPNGVGVWAAGYVQPVCHLDSAIDGERAVDHFLSMLSICVNPIRKREDYLKCFLSPEVINNSWTVVDNDGEEERELLAISETDLLCLLNQFSFDQLFSTWFQRLQQSHLTEPKMLRLFAFELTVLRILFDGVRAYNNLQYRQLCKQLAYVMRQSVQYVAEFWSYFKSLQSDEILCDRLQLEFDRLVLYTVFYGVSSKGLGVWQFLADLPYGDVSRDFQWRIVDLLLSSASDGVSPRDLFDKPLTMIQEEMKDAKILELRLHDLDETDAAYLLTALSNMACASSEILLIRTLTTILFTACFEKPSTRETHHKAGRELISVVVEKNTELFSYLLTLTESRLDYLGGYALELFDHLPLAFWPMGEDDWSVLRRWLFEPLASLKNTLAQRILFACNWGFAVGSKSLLLSPRLHSLVAEAVVKAYDELCPVQAGLISGSIKKASKLASSVSGQLSTEPLFMEFCWKLLLRLKLHPFEYESLDVEVGGSDFLTARFESGNPFAAFVLFQLMVRDVDSMMRSGLDFIERLLNNYFATPATVCITYAMRLFAAAENVQNDESLYKLINALVHVDDTYYNYAKTFIVGDVAGLNLSNFGSMLSEAVLTLAPQRQSEASKFVNYAIGLVCRSSSEWSSDRSFLYVLNQLIEASFLIDPSLDNATKILSASYEDIALSQNRQSKGGVLSWFRGEKPPPPLVAPSFFSVFPWVAYCAIKSEEAALQPFYRSLTSEIMRHPSQNLETCIKNAAGKLRMNFTVDRLAARMYLDLACTIDSGHPLLPLVCQECCLHLFQRLRLLEDPSLPAVCFGALYSRDESFSNKVTALSKKCRSIAALRKEAHLEPERAELFAAIGDWLSDGRLFVSSQPASIAGLPLPYVFEIVLNGNKTPWLERVDFGAVRRSVEERAAQWSKFRYGESSKTNYRPQLRSVHLSPLHRLHERLKNVDGQNSRQPPAVVSVDSVFLTLDFSTMRDKEQLLGIVDSLLDNFHAAASDFNDAQEAVISLDEVFFQQLKALYADFNTQITITIKCNRHCSHPNNMKTMAKCSKLLDNVQNSLDQNRVSWSGAVDNISALLSHNFPHHCGSFAAIVRDLTQAYTSSSSGDDAVGRLKRAGVALFYHFLSKLSDRIMSFPPTVALAETVLKELGSVFLRKNGDEIESLFDLLKEKPKFQTLLLEFFDTDCASNAAFLRMYRKVIDWTVARAMDADRLTEILIKMKVEHASTRLNTEEVGQLNRLALLGCSSAKTEIYASALVEFRRHWTDSFTLGLPSNFRSCSEWLLTACEQGAAPADLLGDICEALLFDGARGDYRLGPASFVEMVTFLSEYFQRRKSRCKGCKMFGIYHCWEPYASKLWPLFKECFERSIFNPEAYSSTAEGVRRCVSFLEALFRPWIEPDQFQNEIGSPWSLSVSSVAECFFKSYVSCLIETSQRCSDEPDETANMICAASLDWYFEKVDPHLEKLGAYVLRTYHVYIMQLPWFKYRPSIKSLETLRQMMERDRQSAPFVTLIVVRLPWTGLLRSTPDSSRSAVVNLLLNIVVRCAAKERNYADCKASLPEWLQRFSGCDWNFLELSALGEACDYVLRAYDHKSVLRADDKSIESGVFKLLAAASYFASSPVAASSEASDSITQKRLRFVRLLVASAVRCSRCAEISPTAVAQFFVGLIGRIDSLLRLEDDGARQRHVALQLLSEAALFWNQINKQLFDDSVEAVGRFLADHPDSSIPLILMRAYGSSAVSAGAWLAVAEKCVEAHFTRHAPPPSWAEVLEFLSFKESWTIDLKSECQHKGHVLVFYAVCWKRLATRKELSEETSILRDVIDTLKQINERHFPEAATVTLIGFALHLLVRQSQFGAGAASIVALVRELVACLQNAAEGKSGILSSLGLTRRISYSPRFQLLCAAICNYEIQQIIDDDRIRSTGAAMVTNSRMPWAKNLRNQKQYVAFVGAIDAADSFISDPSMHFGDAFRLFAKIAPALFAERYVTDQCIAYGHV